MRVEGEYWVGYYALPDTMRDAILLGSIRMAMVQREDRKKAFMNLMREVVADIIEEIADERPTWGEPAQAPEHERSGNA